MAVGRSLRLEDLEAVARGARQVVFGPEARAWVAASRAAIDAIALQGDEAPRARLVDSCVTAMLAKLRGSDVVSPIRPMRIP